MDLSRRTPSIGWNFWRKTAPNFSFVKDHLTLNELKRNILIGELRAALNTGPDYDDRLVLWICGISETTVATDIAEAVAPWSLMCEHYHLRALRALEDRVAGKTPSNKTLRERVAAAMLVPRGPRR